jgi:hypothetical protein
MDTCSITLGQINFPAKHNLQIYTHKKVNKPRSIVQKIGVKLMHFSILYDFLKLMEKLKIKMELAWNNVEGKCKNAWQFE